jgi:rhombotail lipoprotein
MKILPILLAALSAVGCSASFNPRAMEERQWGGEKFFTDDDLRRIEQLRPQLTPPIRLAIAPPMYEYGSPEQDGEREAIEAWSAELKKTGLVKEVILLPKILLGTPSQGRHTHDYFKAVRVAAARVQADAVLLMSSVTDVSSYLNPLSILDLTIVGIYVAPGHHKDAMTIVEGIVMDNRNEYVYWTGSAKATGTTTAPLVYIDKDDAIRKSRVAALKAFGERLAANANAFKPVPPGERYDSPGK